MITVHATNRQAERALVRTCIAALARAIDDGAVMPSREQLQDLLKVCEQLRLPEALRIRRWLDIPIDPRTVN